MLRRLDRHLRKNLRILVRKIKKELKKLNCWEIICFRKENLDLEKNDRKGSGI